MHVLSLLSLVFGCVPPSPPLGSRIRGERSARPSAPTSAIPPIARYLFDQARRYAKTSAWRDGMTRPSSGDAREVLAEYCDSLKRGEIFYGCSPMIRNRSKSLMEAASGGGCVLDPARQCEDLQLFEFVKGAAVGMDVAASMGVNVRLEHLNDRKLGVYWRMLPTLLDVLTMTESRCPTQVM